MSSSQILRNLPRFFHDQRLFSTLVRDGVEVSDSAVSAWKLASCTVTWPPAETLTDPLLWWALQKLAWPEPQALSTETQETRPSTTSRISSNTEAKWQIDCARVPRESRKRWAFPSARWHHVREMRRGFHRSVFPRSHTLIIFYPSLMISRGVRSRAYESTCIPASGTASCSRYFFDSPDWRVLSQCRGEGWNGWSVAPAVGHIGSRSRRGSFGWYVSPSNEGRPVSFIRLSTRPSSRPCMQACDKSLISLRQLRRPTHDGESEEDPDTITCPAMLHDPEIDTVRWLRLSLTNILMVRRGWLSEYLENGTRELSVHRSFEERTDRPGCTRNSSPCSTYPA